MTTFRVNPFSPDLDAPLYQQLYTHMRMSILYGELKGGMKLPSTRALADELNVSRNTVLNTYRQLLAEGYLESIKGSGTFVANVLPDALLTAPRPTAPKNARPLHTESLWPLFSEQAKLQMAVSQPPSGSSSPRPFLAETPALDAFPYQLWSRLVIKQARRMPVSNFMYQDSAGYRPLREAIAAHVTISRQVRCKPEQIMIVPGSQGALDLASRMLINTGDPVWMEDPGYSGARGAFLGSGAHIIPVPVDNQGLVVEWSVQVGAEWVNSKGSHCLSNSIEAYARILSILHS